VTETRRFTSDDLVMLLSMIDIIDEEITGIPAFLAEKTSVSCSKADINDKYLTVCYGSIAAHANDPNEAPLAPRRFIYSAPPPKPTPSPHQIQ
jgi:hypothetical protein